jgi:hypothetical protein
MLTWSYMYTYMHMYMYACMYMLEGQVDLMTDRGKVEVG